MINNIQPLFKNEIMQNPVHNRKRKKINNSNTRLNDIKYILKEKTDPVCPICLEAGCDMTLPCFHTHTMHLNCFNQQTKLICPICRYDQLFPRDLSPTVDDSDFSVYIRNSGRLLRAFVQYLDSIPDGEHFPEI
jgi:lipoate synthase